MGHDLSVRRHFVRRFSYFQTVLVVSQQQYPTQKLGERNYTQFHFVWKNIYIQQWKRVQWFSEIEFKWWARAIATLLSVYIFPVSSVYQQNNNYNHTTTNRIHTSSIFKWNTTDLSDSNKINCVMCIWMWKSMTVSERMSNWVSDREMDRNEPTRRVSEREREMWMSQRDIVSVNGGGWKWLFYRVLKYLCAWNHCKW